MAYRYAGFGDENDRRRAREDEAARAEQEAQTKAAQTQLNQSLDPNYEPEIMPGAPRAKKWESLIDPATGQIKSQYQISSNNLTPELTQKLDGINLDKRGLEKFREYALSTGDSEFAKKLLEKQGLEQQTALQDAAASQAGQAAQARSQMAMRGGINSGASERLARANMLSGYAQKQGINRQGLTDRLQIQANDANQRVQALSKLPDMEVNALNPEFKKAQAWYEALSGDRASRMSADQFNVGNTLSEITNKRNYDQNMWNQQTQAWGSVKAAEASKPKDDSSWLCTEADKKEKLSFSDLKALMKLRKYSYKVNHDLSYFYHHDCDELVTRMKKEGSDWEKNYDFVREIIKLTKEEKIPEAYELYVKTTVELIKKYWPECSNEDYLAVRGA
jgi:hypothetical protein